MAAAAGRQAPRPILVLRAQAAGAVQVRLGNSRARVAQPAASGFVQALTGRGGGGAHDGRDVRSPNLVL